MKTTKKKNVNKLQSASKNNLLVSSNMNNDDNNTTVKANSSLSTEAMISMHANALSTALVRSSILIATTSRRQHEDEQKDANSAQDADNNSKNSINSSILVKDAGDYIWPINTEVDIKDLTECVLENTPNIAFEDIVASNKVTNTIESNIDNKNNSDEDDNDNNSVDSQVSQISNISISKRMKIR